MRVLSNGLAFAFDKVEAKPHTVSLQIINGKVGWWACLHTNMMIWGMHSSSSASSQWY
jgi:hypothetical protein